MSTVLVTLFTSTFLFSATCGLFTPNTHDEFSTIYPFVEKWFSTSKTKMLIVVFDDYKLGKSIKAPQITFDRLNISTKVVTLKYIISLKRRNMWRNYQAIESGSCVLLLFSDTEHLREILASPHLTSFWQPDNFYILQERNYQLSTPREYERFCTWAFERLWRFRRVFKLILFIGDKVIRYNPFDYAGQHAKYLSNKDCDWYCIKTHEDSFLLESDANNTDISDFLDENRRSFDRCPLKISIFKTSTMSYRNGKYGGLDYQYVQEVTKMMNVTPVLGTVKDKYGWGENGAFYGTVGQMVYEFSDVSFNEFFVKDYFTRQMEFTASITSDKLCVIVPKAQPVPDYLIILKVFTVNAWLIIVAIQFVISIIFTIIKDNLHGYWCFDKSRKTEAIEEKNIVLREHTQDTELVKEMSSNSIYPSKETQHVQFTKEASYSTRFERTLLSGIASLSKYLTKVVLQLMQPFEPIQPCFPERLLLMSSLCMSIILYGLFTSQLASMFSKRLYYEDIDTLEELEESGLSILTNSKDVVQDALTDATSPLIKRLHQRLQYANESEIQRRLFETKDAGFLHRFRTIPLKYNENQRQTLHVVKECPKDYILAFVLTKGSPFRHRINNILGRLNSGGFYDKWYRNTFQSQRMIHWNSKSIEHRKITMKHLSIPFLILYTGLMTSVIVFVCERRRNSP